MGSQSVDPQFDSFLGGNQVVPGECNLSEFIKHRMEEIVMLTEAIENSPFRGQTFQRLPKHMRRRQMSHYIKRLPRKLQRPYLTSLKDGPPEPAKRPSRKYRRRPGNLLLEYNRRQKNSVWLETHIWHAKRYHMTTKWGYRLPEKPVNKSFRACYRAISEHCLLIDMSYYNCIELKGPKSELLEYLKQCTSPECGLTFGAKMYLNGTREGSVMLFHPNTYPYKVIGRATFFWQPLTDDFGGEKIWIWIHPLLHNEVVDCFKLLFDLSDVNVEPNKDKEVIVEQVIQPTNKRKKSEKQSRKKIEQIKLEPKNVPFIRTPKYVNKSGSITMVLLKDTLNRFQLTGPLSQAIISQAFSLVSTETICSEVEFLAVENKKRKLDEEIIQKSELEIKMEETKKDKNWWEKYYGNEKCLKNLFDRKIYQKMSQCTRSSDMPSGMILGLVIEDPRLKIPLKREKAGPKVKEGAKENWTYTEVSSEADIESAKLWPCYRNILLRSVFFSCEASHAIHETLQMPITSIDPIHSQSPIWIPEIRDEVSIKKLTIQEINEARSKLIVPGFDVKDVIPNEKQSKIPVLLVQRPGRNESRIGKLGLGSGWDVITPAGFGMPIWLSLIFRGARTGGLKESELLSLECNNLSEFLPPDSAAGELENKLNYQKLKTGYFKLPPNKRANFTKLGVLSPFYLPWKILIRDWILRAQSKTEKLELEKVKFCVLRDSKVVRELSEIVDNFAKKGADSSKLLSYGVNYLVPVVIEYSGKGNPKDMALICVPENKDFDHLSNSGPVEPSHVDENEKSRKSLKSEHSKLLKSLKRKRRKEKAKMKEEFASSFPGKLKWKDILKSNSTPSEPHSKEYNAKMEGLWLPDVENIESVVDSCSRNILGFIVKGGFSFTKSHGLGLGYVTLPGLVEVFDVCRRNKSKVVVLVRNVNHTQYRFGRLRVEIE